MPWSAVPNANSPTESSGYLVQSETVIVHKSTQRVASPGSCDAAPFKRPITLCFPGKHNLIFPITLCFPPHRHAKTGSWWAHQDSNLEPRDYESRALTIEL